MKTLLLLLLSLTPCLADSKAEVELRAKLAASEQARVILTQQMAQLRAASFQLQTTNTILTNILQRQSKQLADEVSRLRLHPASPNAKIDEAVHVVQLNTDTTIRKADQNTELIQAVETAVLTAMDAHQRANNNLQSTYLKWGSGLMGSFALLMFLGLYGLLCAIRKLQRGT